jgi:Tol biopolymer transport system component
VTLAPGTRLGVYEIDTPIGAGGMGQVYRATDTALGRQVAIKILPERFVNDPERVARFEREARTLAALNHPHIATIHALETSGETHALVMELVDGEDLSVRIAHGAIPVEEAVAIARQIVAALDAAHEHGVVHRDLKPGNIKLRADGTVKVLDFGLAKAVTQDSQTPPGESVLNSPTMITPGMTTVGHILGTAAYMAPEQARGRAVDKRADIWAFGCVLYEMLTGRRLFHGEDVTDTIVAVMSREVDWNALPADVPPAVRATLRRCLEKDPRKRLRDIADVDLSMERAVAAPPPPARHPAWRAIAVALLLATGLAIGWAITNAYSTGNAPVNYQRFTFQRGTVFSARLDPVGREVIYSAAWDGGPVTLYSTLPGSNEAQPANLPQADVLSVSQRGELLVLQKSPDRQWRLPSGRTGTLLRSSRGGAARTLAEDVLLADWLPNGEDMAVVRRTDGLWSIERPLGTVVRKTPNIVSALRASPDGRWLALAEKSIGYGGSWSIVFLDSSGAETRFDAGTSGDFLDLAWAPGAREVWFNAYQGADPEWRAMDTSGATRSLLRAPIPLRIRDVSPDGRVLAERSSARYGVMGQAPGDDREREYSWLDSTELDGITADGRTLLLTEFGEGVGYTTWSVGLRHLDRSGVVRIGSGQAYGLSPDGTRVLTMRQGANPSLALIPTGAGARVAGRRGNVVNFTTASWAPDGASVVFEGVEQGKSARYYRQSITAEAPEPLTPEDRAGEYTNDLGTRPVSPDGKTVALPDRQGRLVLFPLGGPQSQGTVVPGISGVLNVLRWTPDGCCVYVRGTPILPVSVRKIDVSSRSDTVWRRLDTIDPVGLGSVYSIQIADDGRAYYYTFQRSLSDLFLVDGVK